MQLHTWQTFKDTRFLNSAKFDMETDFIQMVYESAPQILTAQSDERLVMEAIVATHSINQLKNIDEAKISDWIKKKGKQIASGAEKAKDATVKFAKKFMDNFKEYAQFVVEKISNMLKKVWEFIKEQTVKSLNSMKEEMLQKTKEIFKASEEDQIKKEAKALGELTKGAVNYLTNGFSNKLETSMQKVGDDDVSENYKYTDQDVLEQAVWKALYECLKEDGLAFYLEIQSFKPTAISESSAGVEIPGITKLVHKLEHYPPFKQLHKIETFVAKQANNFLNKLSKIGEALGFGKETEFEVMGKPAGLIAGYQIKAISKNVVKAAGAGAIQVGLAATVPILAVPLKIMKILAKAIWLHELVMIIIESGKQFAKK